MPIDTRITRRGLRVPVVAFFGTKGGVGKTTIARRFAELVTLAAAAPNVLLVDSDVHHRGMTVEMTSDTPVACKTVHDYIATKNTSDVEAANVTGMVRRATPNSGKLFFIPASVPESAKIFEESARIGPEPMLQVLYDVVRKAVESYDCSCVVIDCGPIIDPYTAAAAYLSDRAFIIGQNEPISFSSLKTYPDRIRDFYRDFSTGKMKVIINKVRGWDLLKARAETNEIFAQIPFTLDIVDISEGLSATNEMQLMMFEDHIAQIVEKVFRADHPELIPDRKELLPPQWSKLIQNSDRLEHAPAIKRLGMLRLLMPIGILACVVGGVLFYGASTERHRAENSARANDLVLAERAAASEAPGNSQLQTALQLAESVDPSQNASLAQAIKAAQDAGLKELPPVKRQDTDRENTGIAILLGGFVIGGVGYSGARTRRGYLAAIQGLRSNGAQWLMAEMKSKRSSRKTFDKLLKMAH